MMGTRAAMSAAKCEVAFRATPDPALDETSEAANVSANQRAAVKRNLDAIGILTVSFMGNPGMMSILYRTVNNDWPNGRAWMVFARLTKKYEKDTMVAEEQRKHMLSQITMKKNDDPETVFNQIATINMHFGKVA